MYLCCLVCMFTSPLSPSIPTPACSQSESYDLSILYVRSSLGEASSVYSEGVGESGRVGSARKGGEELDVYGEGSCNFYNALTRPPTVLPSLKPGPSSAQGFFAKDFPGAPAPAAAQECAQPRAGASAAHGRGRWHRRASKVIRLQQRLPSGMLAST